MHWEGVEAATEMKNVHGTLTQTHTHTNCARCKKRMKKKVVDVYNRSGEW